MSSAIALHPQRLRDWLESPEVVGPDGAVPSWLNPEHQGYRYPEIAGLLLNLLAQDPNSDPEVRRRVAIGLGADVALDGGLGRAGIRYVFDSAMALTGLVAERRRSGRLPDESLPGRLFQFISTLLAARQGATAPTSGPDAHWSTSYGCHLLKVAISLLAYRDMYGEPRAERLIEQLIADLVPLGEDGRFRIHRYTSWSYLHAHCYATEGILAIAATTPSRLLGQYAERSGLWLARIQHPSGGLRAWYDDGPVGELHADATAQAIRIWSLLDRTAFSREIALALAFLESLAVEEAGIRYAPTSADVNVWATIFAVQALEWAEQGGNARWIV